MELILSTSMPKHTHLVVGATSLLSLIVKPNSWSHLYIFEKQALLGLQLCPALDMMNLIESVIR